MFIYKSILRHYVGNDRAEKLLNRAKNQSGLRKTHLRSTITVWSGTYSTNLKIENQNMLSIDYSYATVEKKIDITFDDYPSSLSVFLAKRNDLLAKELIKACGSSRKVINYQTTESAECQGVEDDPPESFAICIHINCDMTTVIPYTISRPPHTCGTG